MGRTSIAAVEAVFRSGTEGSDYDGTSDLQPFIDTANSIVNKVRDCAISKGTPLSSTDLELIERWLSAWSYCNSDRTYSSRSTGGASGSFHGQTGMHFDSNFYGQQALMLDNTGCLQAIGKNVQAGVVHTGKVPSERIPYSNRS